MKKIPLTLVTIAATAAGICKVDASATRVAFVDAFATARGNAFTATADNPSAVFYNAAGLTQLEGTEMRANVFSFSAQYEFDGAFISDAKTDDSVQHVPSLFIAHKFEDKPYAIGFGVYAPFALGLDWGSNSSIATAFVPLPYEAELKYIKFHPVFAWQVTETFSIGLGPSFDHSEVEIKSFNPALGSFEGEDQTLGYSLSAMWQPNEHHSFGLNYQAATKIEYEGTSSLLGSAKATLDFPESIVFGYSWRPAQEWNFEFNVDWTNWDKVNDLVLSGNNVPVTIPIPLNWKSAFIWEFGATRYFENGWNVSAGYTYVENAVPDETFIPIIPDSDRNFFAIGMGRATENLTWQVTYQFSSSEERTVSGSNFVTPDGEYNLKSQAFAFSVAYSF